MKIIRREDNETLLLEVKDFKTINSMTRVANNSRGFRFNTVLVPEEKYEVFEDTELYRLIQGSFYIGGVIQLAKFIKY